MHIHVHIYLYVHLYTCTCTPERGREGGEGGEREGGYGEDHMKTEARWQNG